MFIFINYFKYKYKMESIKEENKQGKTVEVPLELIQSVRNVIEVANERIKWKTDELLPVGILLKHIDDIIKENTAN